MIGQPFVQFCFRRFVPSVVCSVFSVSAYFPLMPCLMTVMMMRVMTLLMSFTILAMGVHSSVFQVGWDRGGYRSPDDWKQWKGGL